MYNKNMIKKIVILMLVVILLGGGFYFFKPKEVKKEEPLLINNREQISPTQVSLMQTIEKGTVEGKICYPSSFIPDGQILAKNVETKEVFPQIFKMEGSNQEFEMELTEGKYVFAYKPDDTEGMMGFYSPCAVEMETCATDESHELIEVKIKAGERLKNIDICDYYYEAEQERWD